MDLFKLEKPNPNKIEEERIGKLLVERKKEILNFFQSTIFPKYLYWDKVKFKEPPKGIELEEAWFITKLIRDAQSVETIIAHEKRQNFSWVKIPGIESFLHDVDMKLGGSLLSFGIDIEDKRRSMFVSKGIIEEAIASSQLEGANTTRKVAKTMIREGRKPKTSSEQMIMNNYEAMQSIENEYKEKKLDKKMLLELHRMIAHDTDIPLGDQGRFRRDSDEIVVHDDSTGIVYHVAPKERFLKKELSKLIAFANDEKEVTKGFIHPVVKAIMIHFWVGYLHPFTDGNGRMARLLFYWYLLKHGYWAFSYLPISKVIKRAKKIYVMAYVYSEQDEADLTYFIDYHIKRIQLAMEEFEMYVEEVKIGNRKMNVAAKDEYELNDRQIQTLQYLYDAPDEYTTIRAHQNINQISRKTAHTDLKQLVKLNFLFSKKKGRRVFYFGTDKIKELFD